MQVQGDQAGQHQGGGHCGRQPQAHTRPHLDNHPPLPGRREKTDSFFLCARYLLFFPFLSKLHTSRFYKKLKIFLCIKEIKFGAKQASTAAKHNAQVDVCMLIACLLEHIFCFRAENVCAFQNPQISPSMFARSSRLFLCVAPNTHCCLWLSGLFIIPIFPCSIQAPTI